jgi:hypothetical protein
MSEDARLAHFYYGRHGNPRFHLDPHTTRQTTKSYVKGGNAFWLIFHWASSLADKVWTCFSYRELMALVVAVVAVVAAVAVAAVVWAWEVERPQMLACA